MGAQHSLGSGTPPQSSGQPEQGPTAYVRPGEGVEDVVPDNGALSVATAHAIAERSAEQESAAKAAAAASGGYELDADAMRALLPTWEGIRDELGKLVDDAFELAKVTAPAQDWASEGHINSAKTHQQIYYGIAQQQYKYAREYTQALSEAIAKVEEAERAAGEELRKTGEELA